MEFWQTIAAVIVGGALTFLGTIAAKIWEHRQRRRVVGQAIRAEIDSTLKMTERRGYEEMFQGYVDRWKAGEALDATPGIIGFDEQSDQQAYPVMFAHLGDLGALRTEDASDVVRFYSGLLGIRSDIKAISRGHVTDPQHKLRLVETDLQLWREIRDLGQSLVERLGRS